MDNFIADDLLKYLSDSDNISVNSIVAHLKEMEKRQRYLKMHDHDIWLAPDGYWKTKIQEGDKKRLIKRKSKSDVENVVIDYYKKLSQNNNNFKARFDIWVERQRACGRSENTISKYQSDYRRFFEGYPIEDIDIQLIDETVLSKHIIQVLKEKPIPWRAFKDIMGYTSGVYDKAVRDRIIQENPFKYLDLPIYRKYCYVPPVKTTKQRTLSENDIHTLMDRLHNPRAHNVNKMCCFAIELALYTGMRVGELSALMWDDIVFDEDIIVIRHSEKYDRTTKQSFITTVKNGKERVFPLVDEIRELVLKVKQYESDRGWLSEFVFNDADGRLTKSKISDTTRNITMSDDFSGIKSIHAIRRTFNSNLKHSGANTTMASSLLGHSERVNEQNYTYDMSELNEKRLLIQSIVTVVTENEP